MDGRDLTVLLLVVLGVIVLLPVLGMSMWGFGMMGPGMMGGATDPGVATRGAGGGWFGGLGPLMLLLLIAGVALLVLGLTRREARPDQPLEILKRRLASGEITKEQYEDLKHALGGP